MNLTKYKITKHEKATHIFYTLTGQRGAKYDLLRNQYNPEILFAINRKNPFDKVFYFTDKNGQLESIKVWSR